MEAAIQVIVNADDLGASPAVNAAIFELMAQCRISSATILGNGPAIEDAAQGTRQFPPASFGVHLNLTEFRPLTNAPGLRPLLGPDGCFAKQMVRSVRLTRELRAAILYEWSAQVDRIKSLGVEISHLDSHHHVHTIHGLFGVLKQLQRRFGIRKVRISMNLHPARRSWRLRLSKMCWNEALRRFYSTTTTDVFTSLEVFVTAAGHLRQPPQSIELMTHPGASKYQAESELLLQDALRKLPFPVRLISYNQL